MCSTTTSSTSFHDALQQQQQRRPCTLPLLSSSAVLFSVSSDDNVSSSRLPPPHPFQSSASPSSASAANRKRRAAPLHRIDLGAVAAVPKELCSSNESLNSDEAAASDAGARHPSPFKGGEECLSSSSAAAAGTTTSNPSAGPPADGLDPLKRLRLCSTSSTATSVSGSESDTDSGVVQWSPAVQQQQQQLPQHLLSLAELENGGGGTGDESTSPKQSHQLASSGLVVGDELCGRFELVGDGRNCKAVDVATQAVFHCQVMKSSEWKLFNEIMARVQAASAHYSEEEFELRRDLLLPLPQLRVARNSAAADERVYVLLPDHHGNLHQLVEEEEQFWSSPGRRGGGSATTTTRHTERKMQPILRQIATLLEFCHRVGLFFRDFRLRKFVFSDPQRTRIRVNNVLDLCLAADPSGDALAVREFVPAYVAPEILDKKNGLYGARAADVWAFGVLMFTLLNGRYPFFEASPSPIALLRRIRAHRFSYPISASLSEPAKWLLHALLHQSPAERPTAAELLAAHWFRADAAVAPEERRKLRAETGGRTAAPHSDGSSAVRERPKHLVAVVPAGLLAPTPAATNGRASPAAAQVPLACARAVQSPTVEARAPVFAAVTANAGGERRRARRSSSAVRRAGGEEEGRQAEEEAEWTRHVRALLADGPLAPRATTTTAVRAVLLSRALAGWTGRSDGAEVRRPRSNTPPAAAPQSAVDAQAGGGAFRTVPQPTRRGCPPMFVPVRSNRTSPLPTRQNNAPAATRPICASARPDPNGDDQVVPGS